MYLFGLGGHFFYTIYRTISDDTVGIGGIEDPCLRQSLAKKSTGGNFKKNVTVDKPFYYFEEYLNEKKRLQKEIDMNNSSEKKFKNAIKIYVNLDHIVDSKLIFMSFKNLIGSDVKKMA